MRPRILHFYSDLSGYTLCGKYRDRVRATSHIAHWDSSVIAGGRRCPACAPAVEQARTIAKQAKAVKP